MEQEQREIFKNTTRGWISVMKVDRRGEAKAEPLAAGETVALTEEEQQLTIKQHRDPRVSNPFLNQPYEITDPESGVVIEAGERPVLQRVSEDVPLPTSPEEPTTPGAPEDAGDGEAKGQHLPGEETGVPS